MNAKTVLMSAVPVALFAAGVNASDTIGILTDRRDGNWYKTVTIEGKRWMAQNLNYQTTSGSWCYKNDDSNCDKYGRLYDWNTAKTACPAGYRLPSRQEWDALGQAAGGKRMPDDEGNIDWDDAGKKLKARSGWKDNGNGTDGYGFSALPGGYRYYSDGSFYSAGFNGYWWTATEHSNGNAYYRYMSYNYVSVDEDNKLKGNAFSVRCVAD